MKLIELEGTKEKGVPEDKINELETNSKNKNVTDLYRGMNEFKKGFQVRTTCCKH
jgi:hypothetical protein